VAMVLMIAGSIYMRVQDVPVRGAIDA
jgi:hypothetical protein